MNISEVLKQAWAAVENSGVPKDIQESAFNAAVLLLTRKSDQENETTKLQIKPTAADSPTQFGAEDNFYNLIIERTNIDKASLEKLVYLEDDEPRLLAGAIKGNLTNAEAIRSIAHVLTIARSLGLGQQGAAIKMIRTECDRLKRNDETNFKRHIKKIENFAFTTKDNIEYLIPRPAAFDEFPKVVEKLLGGIA